MWGRLVVSLLKFALERAVLGSDERNLLTALLLEGLQARPLADILYIDEDKQLIVNGKPADMEQMRLLHGHARAALDNKTLSLIREQVAILASIGGAVKAAKVEDLIFYRAALWWGQQEDFYLKLLAQRDQEEAPDL